MECWEGIRIGGRLRLWMGFDGNYFYWVESRSRKFYDGLLLNSCILPVENARYLLLVGEVILILTMSNRIGVHQTGPK